MKKFFKNHLGNIICYTLMIILIIVLMLLGCGSNAGGEFGGAGAGGTW